MRRGDVLGDLIIEKADGWMKNAERHRMRGDKHLKDGHPERAARSYDKAERNMKHATDELKHLATWNRKIKVG